MASPLPEKLQSPHNFLHTHLKWNHHRTGRTRLAGAASSSSLPPSNPRLQSPPLRPHTHTPRHNSPANVSWRPLPPHKQSTVHESEFVDDRNYAGFQLNDRTSNIQISESLTKSDDYDNKRKRCDEICIRFRENNTQHDAGDEENHTSTTIDDLRSKTGTLKAADDESSPRTWNLRPRRLPVNRKQPPGGVLKIGSLRLQEKKTSRDISANKRSSELNVKYGSDTRTTELPRISISLSRDEIEEDILFLTGLKPCRRPKKRPRAIQKQLDNLFPGLWLDSITYDSYKVSEAASKG